jgi:glycosyltransferase involved in cell wall biosynthesis
VAEEETTVALTGLRVRGPFKGLSGYDHLVREFARELHNQGVAVQLVACPECGPVTLPAAMRDPWFDLLAKPVDARIVLHICLPPQVRQERKRINVNYTMFEATRVPSRWVWQNRKHDLVIVPTESSRGAWLNSGMPEEQIRMCPMGINAARFSGPVAPLPLRGDTGEPLSQYRVRFLNVSELNPRKNLLGLLRTWIRGTSRQDDAVLMIKLSVVVPGWLDQFKRRVDRLQRHLRKGLHEAAPVHFIYDRFTDADMPRLYAAATHYISMSFGEGWDQPMLEAAASRLKLIAPNHSAYTTYLDPSIASLMASREVPAIFAGWGNLQVLFANANWWEPDEEQAVDFIRAAIEGRDGGKASARDHILREYTWENATRRLIAILSEVEARTRRRGLWFLPPMYGLAATEGRHSSPDAPPGAGRS